MWDQLFRLWIAGQSKTQAHLKAHQTELLGLDALLAITWCDEHGPLQCPGQARSMGSAFFPCAALALAKIIEQYQIGTFVWEQKIGQEPEAQENHCHCQ